MTIIQFTGSTVALIVRGKNNAVHEPSVAAQHADCILSDGSPIGFFGEDGAGTGESSGSSSGASTATSNVPGFNMKGAVYDYILFQKNRPRYVDQTLARKFVVVSTVLIVQVTTEEARKFKEFWDRLKTSAGTFNLLGHNCSTGASKAFRYAGIVTSGIPGLDTPNNLYNQISKERVGKVSSHSGFVGFVKNSNKGFDLIVEPIIKPTSGKP